MTPTQLQSLPMLGKLRLAYIQLSETKGSATSWLNYIHALFSKVRIPNTKIAQLFKSMPSSIQENGSGWSGRGVYSETIFANSTTSGSRSGWGQGWRLTSTNQIRALSAASIKQAFLTYLLASLLKNLLGFQYIRNKIWCHWAQSMEHGLIDHISPQNSENVQWNSNHIQ